MDYYFFFPPPFPRLTKPRNPLPEVKPSLQQGSVSRLFTLNIFWPAEIGGRGRPYAPPGPSLRGAPAPPALPRQQYHRRRSAGTGATCAADLGWQFVYGPRFPSDRRGKKTAASFLCCGTPSPRAVAVSALGGELHKSTTSAKKAAARFLPRPGRERVLPRSLGATRGWRGGKEAEGERESGPGASRGEAGSELWLSREI